MSKSKQFKLLKIFQGKVFFEKFHQQHCEIRLRIVGWVRSDTGWYIALQLDFVAALKIDLAKQDTPDSILIKNHSPTLYSHIMQVPHFKSISIL